MGDIFKKPLIFATILTLLVLHMVDTAAGTFYHHKPCHPKPGAEKLRAEDTTPTSTTSQSTTTTTTSTSTTTTTEAPKAAPASGNNNGQAMSTGSGSSVANGKK